MRAVCTLGVGSAQGVVDRTSTKGAAEGHDDLLLHPKAQRGAPLGACRLDEGPIDGASRHEVLRRFTPRDGKREEHAVHERRGQPVGEADARVGLAEGARKAMVTRRGEHRSGHVAAGSEDHVGAHLLDDPRARERRDGGATERLEQLQRRSTGKARDCEGQERIAARGHQFGLDPLRRTGERDLGSARAELVGHGERGSDVAHRAARGDQNPHWHAPKARPRTRRR